MCVQSALFPTPIERSHAFRNLETTLLSRFAQGEKKKFICTETQLSSKMDTSSGLGHTPAKHSREKPPNTRRPQSRSCICVPQLPTFPPPHAPYPNDLIRHSPDAHSRPPPAARRLVQEESAQVHAFQTQSCFSFSSLSCRARHASLM